MAHSSKRTKLELPDGTPLTVDADDVAALLRFSWYRSTDLNRNIDYAYTKIDGKSIYMHRLIMNAPDDAIVDHIDGDGLNNKKNNLRLVTKSQNGMNAKKKTKTTSKFKGVSFHKRTGKWRAYGRSALTGKVYDLGYYSLEIRAAQVYNEFCVKHNPYARLNVI